MDSFTDTNVPIAYSFTLEPFNIKANSIFNMYHNIYWSNNVKMEYDYVFDEKLGYLSEYFLDLRSCLLDKDYVEVSLTKLLSFLDKNYSNDIKKRIKTSLHRFWDIYVNNKYPTKNDFLEAIQYYLIDLEHENLEKKKKRISKVKLTPERKEKYENIYNQLLKKHAVHKTDAIIALDAHDFNLISKDKINFITFDGDFYNAICQIEEFSFNEILGLSDFS